VKPKKLGLHSEPISNIEYWKNLIKADI